MTTLARTLLPTAPAVFLEGCYAPQVDADGAVEFQGVAACGGFGVAEHHADFHTNLVYENQSGFAFGDYGGEFPHRLAHQSCLKTHVAVAHFAFDFGLRGQRGDRVDNDNVNGIGG